jgi:Protein of unknown function (DUF2924)
MARQSHVTPEKLPDLDLEALKQLWRSLFASSPPIRMPKDFLIKLLAQGLQERAIGGMSKKMERQLGAAAGESDESLAVLTAQSLQGRLSLGSRLVRGWGGKTHEVTVVERGFAYRGKAYRSLTQIAKVITGAHWSGPRFFGLKAKRGLATSVGGDS